MTFSASQIAAAYAFCEKAARDHYENFPAASLLLPRGLRRQVAAIYAFARQADDFADEASYAGHRLELLAGWRVKLRRAAAGEADHPIFIALADAIARSRLPPGLLEDLIAAFERDVRIRSYETFGDLLGYCRLSANPVGRLVLHMFGRHDERLLARSDAICTGLQLANFWQDVAPDLDKGRCYIPREDLRRFGCSRESLALRCPGPAFVQVMRHQVTRTRGLFSQGAALPAAVGGRLGLELRLVLLGGLRILEMIEACGYDVLNRRPALRRADWGRLLVRATLPGRGSLSAAAWG